MVVYFLKFGFHAYGVVLVSLCLASRTLRMLGFGENRLPAEFQYAPAIAIRGHWRILIFLLYCFPNRSRDDVRRPFFSGTALCLLDLHDNFLCSVVPGVSCGLVGRSTRLA
jgi:hypothetical protein